MTLRVLGIDPGSRITGYGVIDVQGPTITYVASGAIRLVSPALSGRLSDLYTALNQIITQYQPNETALEESFVSQNARTALVLGHARGVALLALGAVGAVGEYSPRRVKQAVVGYGAAEKSQVQQMVMTLLSLPAAPKADAADALAVAICHANTLRTAGR